MTQCEMCGCYGARETTEWYRYDLPEMWDALCQECAEHENTHTAEEMDDVDLVAAIMIDSGYYAGPRHAANHVRRWRDGARNAACERGLTVFGEQYISDDGNLDAIMESARATWLRAQEKRPGVVERAVAKAERVVGDDVQTATAGA